jgi:MFS family permease
MPVPAHSDDSTQPAASPDSGQPAVQTPDLGYARYVLGILFLVYVVNFIDRQILSILLDPIKEELGASDTQMGFLTGIAFALFYTGFGIPIARWADRGVRRSIIAIGLTVWSVMTGVCGFAQSFAQLAVARIGVGIGEAAGSPPAHSLISDYFPAEKRASAMSIYNIGIPVGVMIGYLAGGWILEFFNWRVAFFVVSVPGVILALVLRFTVKEPPRGMSEVGAVDTDTDTLGNVVRFLLSLRTFVYLAVACGFSAFSAYGFGSWVPAFLGRVHGMGSGEIGTWIGLESGIGGAIGMLGTGLLADRLGRRDVRWFLWLPAISTVLYLPFSIAFLLLDDSTTALLLYFVPTALSSVYLGPAVALTHMLVKVRMRAVASSIMIFFINLIGMGLGPQAVGIISDAMTPEYGDEGLRWSLLIVLTSKVVAITLFVLAARHVIADLRAKDRVGTGAAAA